MTSNFQMIAKTLFGLEEVLAHELRILGAGNIQLGNRCVYFEGDTGFLYKANLNLRTALRILKPIRDFRLNRSEDLYKEIQRIDWTQYLTDNMSFVVDTVLNSDLFSNSLFVSQKAKDAIADQFRERIGSRPSVSLENPDLRIHLHIHNQTVNLSFDSSGSSLHLRGYRTDTNIAPLNEVLAAGILLLSGWKGESDFLDPMCGSGTLLVEAAMIACNIPAGINRKEFGFQHWRDYDPKLYQVIYNASLKKVKDFKFRISGTDKAPSAVNKAIQNIKNAGLEEYVEVEQADFFKSVKPTQMPLHLVSNPPYGERLEINKEVFYKSWGDTLKSHYPNTRAWIIVGDPEVLKVIGLRASRKIKLYNGSIESRLALFDIYAGSKKAGKSDKLKFGFK